MSKEPAQPQDKYVLRLPDGMRAELKGLAYENNRSLNAEIVQRLKWSIDDSDYLKIKLPPETEAALFTDAAIQDKNYEDRIVEIIQENYGQAEHTATINRVENLANENLQLSSLVEAMEVTRDSDFLLYYTKIVQLFQFANEVLSISENIPDKLRENAIKIKELTSAEIEVVKSRKEEAIYFDGILNRAVKEDE